MKVLLDHNVPHKLSHLLLGHDVKTADQMGWATLKNGDLLMAAELAKFDVMVTADKSLSYQQNLQGRRLALIVLSTNRWKLLKEYFLYIQAAIDRADSVSFQSLAIEPIAQSG